MGFLHYNNSEEEQLAMVVKVKSHIPGFVVTPAVLSPTSTVAHLLAMQVGGSKHHLFGGHWSS